MFLILSLHQRFQGVEGMHVMRGICFVLFLLRLLLVPVKRRARE
jgi:hypothetical protein